jgi:hypothetical protein
MGFSLMDLLNTSRWFIPGRISSSLCAGGGLAVTLDLDCVASRHCRHELHQSQELPGSGLPANLSEDRWAAGAVSWTFTAGVLPAERITANPQVAAARRNCTRSQFEGAPAGLLEIV